SRISGPLLDRIDIHMEVVPVPFRSLAENGDAENSDSIRARVAIARKVQDKRFERIENVFNNAQMEPGLMKQHCKIDREGQDIIRMAMEQLGLSARAFERILKVARTIADLEECEEIRASHVSEAVIYRSLDREGWSG
ncbi:MAG: magnesium chelatase, partial [Bacteroidota bacterium]